MFKFKIYTALLTATLLLNSCLFDSSSDTIVGRYNTTWIDVPSSRAICLAANNNDSDGGIEIIPAYVYAVGHNTKSLSSQKIIR